MNEKEKQDFEELVDEFEKYKRDTKKRIETLEIKVKELEDINSGA